jgi:hypothetical protein
MKMTSTSSVGRSPVLPAGLLQEALGHSNAQTDVHSSWTLPEATGRAAVLACSFGASCRWTSDCGSRGLSDAKAQRLLCIQVGRAYAVVADLQTRG